MTECVVATGKILKKGAISATQKKVCEELAFKVFTGKSEGDIAGEYGVNRSTIWRWKSNPLFNEEVNKIAKELHKSHLTDVNGVLTKLLKSDNEKTQLKAIELYYRNQGLFKDVVEETIRVDTDVKAADILEVLEGL